MCSELISATCNWKLMRGKSIEDAISTKHETKDVESRPDLEEIVSEKTSILMFDDTNSFCYLTLKSITRAKITSLIVISDCAKLELFSGPEQEYIKTISAELLDDFEGCLVYRFDIDIKNLKSIQLNLKFIPRTQQIWIYGALIYLEESNDIFETNKINIANVQKILEQSSYKLSPGAEKCKTFLQSVMNSNNLYNLPNSLLNSSLNNYNNSKNCIINDDNSQSNGSSKENNEILASCNDSSLEDLKKYIDVKIQDMENRISLKILENTVTQNKKLDAILNLLKESK